MGKSLLYVGLDVHKMSVDVAIAETGPAGEVRFCRALWGVYRWEATPDYRPLGAKLFGLTTDRPASRGAEGPVGIGNLSKAGKAPQFTTFLSPLQNQLGPGMKLPGCRFSGPIS